MKVLEFDDGTILRISFSLFEKAELYFGEKGFELESGGILLGTRRVEKPDYTLKDLTFPTQIDKCLPCMFVRSFRAANKVIRNAWRKSHGEINYIGEWHTHNEPCPTPSRLDARLIKNVIKDKSCPLDRVFQLIFGNEGILYAGVAHTTDSGIFVSEVHVRWRE